MKYTTKQVAGYWAEAPEEVLEMRVAMEDWDGDEDCAEDQSIFYYMDGDKLTVGSNLGGFIVTEVFYTA